jgi:hypothetical protein
MAGDDMPAKLVAGLERAFEIDFRAMAPAAGGGDPQGLGGGIDGKPRTSVLLAHANHGEADTGTGDRGALDDRGALVAAGDLDPVQPFRARAHRNHFADVGDDAGEHVGAIIACSGRSSEPVGRLTARPACPILAAGRG